jgi:hypothetical protein
MSSMLEFRDLLLAAISHRVLASPKIFESYTDDPQSGGYLGVNEHLLAAATWPCADQRDGGAGSADAR